MKEIVFKNRKNGMMVLLLTVLLYLAALGGCIWSGVLMEQGVNTVVWLVISRLHYSARDVLRKGPVRIHMVQVVFF